MKASIQTKLLALCILLVLLTAVSISATYYILTKQDKHRESRQRIKIAFDIILDDITDQLSTYRSRFDEFLNQENTRLNWITRFYNQEKSQVGSSQFIVSSLSKVTDELKNFGSLISADRLTLYAADKRLLAVYQSQDVRKTVGGYVISETGNDTYLPMDDFSKLSEMHYTDQPIPDTPLPAGIMALYTGAIPDTITTIPISEGQQIGVRIIAPIYLDETKEGVLVGEVFYRQRMVERFASLSETAVNFFAGEQLSIGTLQTQSHLESETMAQIVPCEDILSRNRSIDIAPISFEDLDYYQGRCAITTTQGVIGAITVSLSQDIEKQEIQKILKAILLISGIGVGVAFVLSVVFSRKTIHSIHNIVSVIGAAAEGDLRKTATVITHDEIGMLARKLNQMIAQLRTISRQVQEASYAVNSTADTILQQMDTLINHMEQQSTSVDNTTNSVEQIKPFIDTVARNTNYLLSAASQILASIQETRASINEVTTSTGSLTTNLHLISSAVDQVNQAVKRISDSTARLEEVTQHTETTVHQIDHSLQEVSHNADRTQELAKGTMDAATRGQTSVEASIQGMIELKDVVANTAQVIEEVNSWGEQVSAILDVVDDITEQTSLLSLNASIISAQAGVHGRSFAVVANEIKELATRTKTSTKEISTLVHELQKKTEEGVTHTAEGLKKADQEMQLANAVKEALDTILEQATRSSNRATDTVQVIQQTVASSQAISVQMVQVTEMVSQIKTAIQGQEQDVEQVVSAVESLSGMAEQINHANVEQKRAAEEIERSMEEETDQFSDISGRTETLQHIADQIVTAMHTIESTTEEILQNATEISEETVKNLVHQSDLLQKIVNVLKVS